MATSEKSEIETSTVPVTKSERVRAAGVQHGAAYADARLSVAERADAGGAPTTLLDRATIMSLMTPQGYYDACHEAFLAEAEERARVPQPWHLKTATGGFHGKGALVQERGGQEYVCLKLNANFPGNPAQGLPTIQGAVLLCDAHNGRLLAIMDSIEVTLRRTAAATALAVRHLTEAAPWRILVIGCGAQAPAQLDALIALGEIESIAVVDRDPDAARRLSEFYKGRATIAPLEARYLQRVSRAASVVVTCTTAQTPVLDVGDISPGTLVCAVGADAAHKSEIAPALMASARVVVDSLKQCAAFGDLHHAIAAGTMRETDVAASLAHVVSARAQARRSQDDIVVFDSTGVASQDAMAAIAILSAARRANIGVRVDLGRAAAEVG